MIIIYIEPSIIGYKLWYSYLFRPYMSTCTKVEGVHFYRYWDSFIKLFNRECFLTILYESRCRQCSHTSGLRHRNVYWLISLMIPDFICCPEQRLMIACFQIFFSISYLLDYFLFRPINIYLWQSIYIL